jgi:hypothetical protein
VRAVGGDERGVEGDEELVDEVGDGRGVEGVVV